mgnify:CR=1 FL=1
MLNVFVMTLREGIEAFLIVAITLAYLKQTQRHALASASLCVMEQGCVPPGWAAARAWGEQHPAAQDPH